MNKEKLIKNQALTSLKGSWIILIAMVLTISAVMIAIYSMGSIVQLITKSLDTATGMAKSGKEFTFTLDRKSTRLNSSHLGISYAVFCLKKTRRGGLVA